MFSYRYRPEITLARSASEGRNPAPRLRVGLVCDVSNLTGSGIHQMLYRSACLTAATVTTLILLTSTVRAESVEYSRDIKRLLSNSCFACHGPDENVREADLRLDMRESVVDDTGAIVPGDADASEAAAGLAEAQTRWENTVEQQDAKDSGLPDNIAKIVRLPADKRNDKQKAELAKHYHSIAPELAEVRKRLAERQRELDEFKKAIPTTLVSISGSPRTMRILPRGNWLDDSGEVVEPAVPETLVSLAAVDRRANRLDFARWLVQPDNPLVARTMVNRLWKLCFGYGIARTLEDMGSQGEWPTHPELLDWLAAEYIESGWDTKHMIQLMVTSATYRQSSQSAPEYRRRDPSNKWLARQSRFRLDAEMVRDGALAISGLLVRNVGGRSVKPYQPIGYWAHLNFPTRKWEKDQGENVYRRGLYTHWQRTFLHPSLLAFDAPSREECTAERPRSNTPQQALVLLNDPTYVEAARVFAERIIRQGGKADDERLAFAFRQALSRPPTSQELQILMSLRKKHSDEYTNDKQAADQFLGIGDRPKPNDVDSAELAAWTSVARVILNLPESIIRY